MRFIVLCHRWAGGVAGLLLAILGLSGALLVYKDVWTLVPHHYDTVVQDATQVGQAVTRMMHDPHPPQMITFATDSLGVDKLAIAKGGGAYADQSGQVLLRWGSDWARPELWLVQLHRYLLVRPGGETVVGVAGLVGFALVLTGCIAWWRTRRTFAPRLLPQRLSRPAIIRHHRDLGVLVTPLLLISFLTGAFMVFRPLGALVLGPGAGQVVASAFKAPDYPHVRTSPDLDWQAMMEEARVRFPKAQFGRLAMPRRGGSLITLSMRQPGDWLPNGAAMVWFAPDTGAVVGVRDGGQAPAQARGFMTYMPLHIGRVGGIVGKALMALSGLSLATLGLLATWTFWFVQLTGDKKKKQARAAAAQAAGQTGG
ncbi:PepSY-associated TM helix domain-containing protein [Acetobacter vaccinii]|uniref:PepSY domain-containing protein n=1 Tax=Acetobacter vaccinii TaxID=2592655 RepID=A0A5C1YLY1_9PROT|nr:PepSY-associated TM helix domain-containing protein [Acetobacter vaccinii]QEO17324.1 PepSY domain-containing protein [Acetobacter vaccinii]